MTHSVYVVCSWHAETMLIALARIHTMVHVVQIRLRSQSCHLPTRLSTDILQRRQTVRVKEECVKPIFLSPDDAFTQSYP